MPTATASIQHDSRSSKHNNTNIITYIFNILTHIILFVIGVCSDTMACTRCGRSSVTETEIEMQLCSDCLEVLLDEAGIKRRGE